MSNWTPFSCPVAALHVFEHSAGASQVHCGQILRASKATGPDVPNLPLHCLQNWWNHFTEFPFASLRYERLAGLLREFRDCLRMSNERTWANPRIPQVRVLEVFGCSRSTHCKPMVRPLQVKRLAGKPTFVRILVCESAPFSRQHDGVYYWQADTWCHAPSVDIAKRIGSTTMVQQPLPFVAYHFTWSCFCQSQTLCLAICWCCFFLGCQWVPSIST